MELDIKSTRNRRIIDFRKYGFKDLQVLGKYNYNKSEDKLTEHIHNQMIEICYYDKGSQFFEVNHEKYLVKGGDVFIHFPGELHGSGGHPEEKGALYWIIIKLVRSADNTLALLCKRLIAEQKRHFKGNRYLKKKLDDIYLAVDKKEERQIKKIRIHLMVQSFLLALLDNLESRTTETDNTRLNKILHYIDENITAHLSLSALAKEANLSESRFKVYFKELTGFTPGDYIQRKKVELALDKIKTGAAVSLSDIAYEFNFSSPQYFSSVVKKYTGQPPGIFKPRMGPGK